MSGQRPLVMIIDDEEGILDVVSRVARRAGYDALTYSNGREAIAELQTRRADLVLVDLRMPEVGGLDVLRAIRDIDPRCQAVLMTGYASVDTAVDAIKLGATDYLSKPLDFTRLEHLLAGVRDDLERRRNVLSIETDLARRLEFCGMIGRSALMEELFAMIRRLAPHVRTALITGETGTGKELVARALHALGPRRDGRFVPLNCSAIADTAFASAFGDTDTLFLDEVGDVPLPLQAKLLDVLELGEVNRAGSRELRTANVHVLAATHRDLRAEVAAGRFRGDLYYRLNIVEVTLPPLRDRREDIPYLTAAFVREAADRLQKPLVGLTPGAERLLALSSWDGNVRELRNVIERACILADSDVISERELSISMPPVTRPGAAVAAPGTPAAAQDPASADLLVTVEREHIQRALVRAKGNKKAAARMLGLSRRALYRRLERLDLGDTIMRRREPAMETANV
jgi:DNA-binding NtrC family response regulator